MEFVLYYMMDVLSAFYSSLLPLSMKKKENKENMLRLSLLGMV
jgi:hypothetical protein